MSLTAPPDLLRLLSRRADSLTPDETAACDAFVAAGLAEVHQGWPPRQTWPQGRDAAREAARYGRLADFVPLRCPHVIRQPIRDENG